MTKFLSTKKRTIFVPKPEFTRFLKSFGIGNLIFYEDDVDDVLCQRNDTVFGFSKKFKNGNIVVIPSKVHSFENKIDALLSTLVESLISYSARLTDKPPKWVHKFELYEESKIKDEIKTLEKKINREKQKLTKYSNLKSILWVGNNELVKNVRKFFDEINLQTERDEIYEEDFWIIDSEENKKCIVEVKGKSKNIIRPDISKLDEHRGARKKPDDFPALLIANTFRRADSLDRKKVDISSNEIEKAVRNNVLLLRTIDLCYLYKLTERGVINTQEILNIFKSEKGWLKVGEEDYEIKTVEYPHSQ